MIGQRFYNTIVITLIDNELPGIAQAVHRSGRPFKGY